MVTQQEINMIKRTFPSLSHKQIMKRALMMDRIIGKRHERNLYNFLLKYPNKWHSYSTDATTKRAVASLKRKGILKTNKYHQFMLK